MQKNGLVLVGLVLVFSPAGLRAGPAGGLPIERDQIRLPGPVGFEPGSAELTPEGRQVLDSVAATLETHLDISRLEIGVHTDAMGSGAYNKQQSQLKADAIRAYLSGKGIPAERLAAVGYGEERPIDTNRTAEGRAHNRRVEFRVLARCPRGQVYAPGGCRPRRR